MHPRRCSISGSSGTLTVAAAVIPGSPGPQLLLGMTFISGARRWNGCTGVAGTVVPSITVGTVGLAQAGTVSECPLVTAAEQGAADTAWQIPGAQQHPDAWQELGAVSQQMSTIPGDSPRAAGQQPSGSPWVCSAAACSADSAHWQGLTAWFWTAAGRSTGRSPCLGRLLGSVQWFCSIL